MGEPEGHSRALRVGPKCQAPLTLACPEAGSAAPQSLHAFLALSAEQSHGHRSVDCSEY